MVILVIWTCEYKTKVCIRPIDDVFSFYTRALSEGCRRNAIAKYASTVPEIFTDESTFNDERPQSVFLVHFSRAFFFVRVRQRLPVLFGIIFVYSYWQRSLALYCIGTFVKRVRFRIRAWENCASRRVFDTGMEKFEAVFVVSIRECKAQRQGTRVLVA